MTTGPFDDELLNAVIDRTADDETVAAVHADPVASARLAELEGVKALVGAAPQSATPERRAASIAAAMAEAQSSAPEGISSLAAARHARDAAATNKRRELPRAWVAAAAAIVVVLLAIPIFNSLGGDRADTASDDTSDASFSADAGDDSADSTDDGETDAMTEDADTSGADMADEASATAGAPADDGDSGSDDAAMDEEASADDLDDAASTTTTSIRLSVAELDARLMGLPLGQIDAEVDSGLIARTYSFTDQAIEDLVEPECLEGYVDDGTKQFDLVIVTDLETRALIGFGPGGSYEVLDAETCALIG